MKKIPIMSAACLLLAACATDPALTGGSSSNGSQSPGLSKLKEYSLVVNGQSLMKRRSGSARVVIFPAKCLSTSIDGRGNLTAVLQLNPAFGGVGSVGENGATQRLVPTTAQGTTVVSVTSKVLAGIPLDSVRSLEATVEASGDDKGQIVGLGFHPGDLKNHEKISASMFRGTFEIGKISYTITFDGGMSGIELTSGDSQDGVTKRVDGISADEGGLKRVGYGEGPDTTDYSYLETQSARGEFD